MGYKIPVIKPRENRSSNIEIILYSVSRVSFFNTKFPIKAPAKADKIAQTCKE